MKLILSQACAIVASLQARVAHCCAEAYNARRAVSRASAEVAGDQVRRIDVRELEAIAARWDATVAAEVQELEQVQTAYAFVLAQFPAANDEHFDPAGKA